MNAPSRPRPPKTMLLIDADNVSTDVMEQAVETLLLQFGALHVRRAYCTAESALKHQAVFKRLGIRPMVNLAAGKNSTDIALAVDALDLVIAERPEVVVIASSDSDFAPLVARLREKGCRVVGIGQQGKTGDETRTVYDDFTVLAHRKAPGRIESGGARGRSRARGADMGSERVGERSPEHPGDRPAERAEARLDTRPAGRSGSRRGGRGGARGRLQDDRAAGLPPVAEALAPAAGALPEDEDRAAAARAQAVAAVMADVMAEAMAEPLDAVEAAEVAPPRSMQRRPARGLRSDEAGDAGDPRSAVSPSSASEAPVEGAGPGRPSRKSPRRRSAAPTSAPPPTPDGGGSGPDAADPTAAQGAIEAPAEPAADPAPELASTSASASRPARGSRAASSRRPARPATLDEPEAPATSLPEAPAEASLPTAPARRGAPGRAERAAVAASAGQIKPARAPQSVPAEAAETPSAPSPDRPRASGRGGRARPASAEPESAPVASAPAASTPAPAVPDRLRQILMVLPELVRGDTVELRVAAERLREGGLLSRSGSSTKVLGAFPDKFELLPERNPNRVRLKT